MNSPLPKPNANATCWLLATVLLTAPSLALAQAGPTAATPEELANAALAAPAEPPEVEAPPQASAPLLHMAWRSRWLLSPIVLLSIAVVAVSVERGLGLRRSRVVPRRLVRRLREQVELGEVDPTIAKETCERYPSAAANVVMAMLTKVGRPHNEVDAAASEEIDRQADRLYANVRTLNLASAVAPLMGLLGTVWGMIQAFFVTASLPIDSNKGQALADGIYVALFTTFAGLAVAIPAAVLAHLFEGRILALMRRVEILSSDLLPFLERFEGNRGGGLSPGGTFGGDLYRERTDPALSGVPGNHPSATISRPPTSP